MYLYEVISDGSIFGHLAITLYETFTGFFIGAICGIGLGFLLGQRETLAQIIDPYIVAFNGIPRIALAPLFIIWFGIGPTSKVVLVVIVVFFLTFFNTYAGIKGVDAELKNILRIMGATERQILMKVTVPAIVPWITTGLKISVPYAIVGAVVGEFIAASKGLGYLINYNTSLFSTTGALGGILVLGSGRCRVQRSDQPGGSLFAPLASQRRAEKRRGIVLVDKPMAKKESAGLLMYRLLNSTLEVFLVHPGGPYWAKKDLGAWSIPKGEFEAGEDRLDAAKREFQEETGFFPEGNFIALAPIKQTGGKVVYGWAVRGNCDAKTIVSNAFSMEWPPRSGKRREFPEVDRAAWFTIAVAKEKILKDQVGLLEELRLKIENDPYLLVDA